MATLNTGNLDKVRSIIGRFHTKLTDKVLKALTFLSKENQKHGYRVLFEDGVSTGILSLEEYIVIMWRLTAYLFGNDLKLVEERAAKMFAPLFQYLLEKISEELYHVTTEDGEIVAIVSKQGDKWISDTPLAFFAGTVFKMKTTEFDPTFVSGALLACPVADLKRHFRVVGSMNRYCPLTAICDALAGAPETEDLQTVGQCLFNCKKTLIKGDDQTTGTTNGGKRRAKKSSAASESVTHVNGKPVKTAGKSKKTGGKRKGRKITTSATASSEGDP